MRVNLSTHSRAVALLAASVCAATVTAAGTPAAANGDRTQSLAGRPSVGVPVPQPFNVTTDCYLRCVTPALVRTTTPTLSASISGTADQLLATTFEVRPWPSTSAPILATAKTGFLSPPSSVQWTVPEGILSPDTPYFWRARSMDEQHTFSKWTAWQMFGIDRTRPDVPAVHSAEYPENQWGAELGTEGVFSFSSDAGDVAEFHYRFGNDHGRVNATGTGPRAASVRYTPPSSMGHTLAVQSIDPAGNTSDPRHYEFWVPTPPLRHSNWTLDDTAADSGNIGADGTVSGDVSFAPGKLSNAAVFNGGTISTAGSVVDTAASFTVMAWANPSGLGSGQTVVAQGAFRLYLDATTNAWCGSLGGTVACADGLSWGPPTVGQWVHLALRFDAIRGELAIFVMGDYESCWLPSERTEVSAAAVASTGPLVIGDGWHGAIDEVWAYRAALQGVEICQAADR